MEYETNIKKLYVTNWNISVLRLQNNVDIVTFCKERVIYKGDFYVIVGSVKS